MPLSFQTEILPAHVRAATAGIFWRQATQPLVLVALGVLWLGLHLMLAVLFAQAPWWLHLFLALSLWGTVGGLLQVASLHYQAQAAESFKRFEGAPVDVRLAEDAYHFQASWGQGSLPWARFQSLWRFKAVWVLLQHTQGGASVLLPAAALDPEARDFIQARLSAAQAKVLA